MLITIAIINYNYGAYLKTAIDSALQQKFNSPFEVLVIDDGSTDDSDEIVEPYRRDGRIRYSKTQNQGFGKSLGRAILEAEGEWVVLMDADDWFTESKLEELNKHFNHTEIHFTQDWNIIVDQNGHPSGAKGSPGNTSTLSVRKRIAESILPVDDESGFHAIDSAGFGLLVPEPLTYHRIHSSSLASNSKKEYERRRIAYQSMAIRFSPDDSWCPSWLDRHSKEKVFRFFHSMETFCSVEVAIGKRQRKEAFLSLIRHVRSNDTMKSILSIGFIKLTLRVLILRPLPSREEIYLKAK